MELSLNFKRGLYFNEEKAAIRIGKRAKEVILQKVCANGGFLFVVFGLALQGSGAQVYHLKSRRFKH